MNLIGSASRYAAAKLIPVNSPEMVEYRIQTVEALTAAAVDYFCALTGEPDSDADANGCSPPLETSTGETP